MANKRLSQLGQTQSMRDSDSIVVIVGGKEYLITKDNFSKVLSTLSTEQKNKISTILLSGDGSKVLTDSGVYRSIDKMFSQNQFTRNESTGLVEINGYHTHANTETLDKFTLDGGKLLFDGKEIGSYTLPVATDNTLGGVKVDGTTITISEDGTISGSSNYELPTATNTVLGGVKVDGDTIKINNGVISADVINNWASGVSYPVGYFVVHNNTLYQCVKANSDIEWTGSNWNLISGGNKSPANITQWESNIDYTINDLVVYENTIYKCNTAHTSNSEFDSEKWLGLTGAKGDKGDNGADGQNGISPTIVVTTTSTGTTIDITDINGTQNFSLLNGINGIDGTNGSDGKSAYQIASENGFEGSEQEWIESLKGQNGDSGITPIIDSETKHWKIGDVDTGVLAEGKITVNADCAVVYATLNAENWSETTPYTQTVVVANITSNNMPIVDLKLSDDTLSWDDEETAYSNLIKIETSDGSITAYCRNKPDIDFTIKMRISGDVTQETFVTKTEFNTLLELVGSANTTLENVLNGGGNSGE